MTTSKYPQPVVEDLWAFIPNEKLLKDLEDTLNELPDNDRMAKAWSELESNPLVSRASQGNARLHASAARYDFDHRKDFCRFLLELLELRKAPDTAPLRARVEEALK